MSRMVELYRALIARRNQQRTDPVWCAYDDAATMVSQRMTEDELREAFLATTSSDEPEREAG